MERVARATFFERRHNRELPQIRELRSIREVLQFGTHLIHQLDQQEAANENGAWENRRRRSIIRGERAPQDLLKNNFQLTHRLFPAENPSTSLSPRFAGDMGKSDRSGYNFLVYGERLG